MKYRNKQLSSQQIEDLRLDQEIQNYQSLISSIGRSKFYKLLGIFGMARFSQDHESRNHTSKSDDVIGYKTVYLRSLQDSYESLISSKSFIVWQIFNDFKKVINSICKKPDLLGRYFRLFIKIGPQGFIKKLESLTNNRSLISNLKKDYHKWYLLNFPNQKALANQRKKSLAFPFKPLISVILPTFNTNPQFLIDCIESIRNQSYPYWELCISDDKSSSQETISVLKKYSNLDKRIKISFRKENGHICRASNSAAKLATGDYLALMDHDDFLWPNALYEVAIKINKFNKAGLIYSDEDKLEEYSTYHVDPFFKPQFNFDYLRSINYITHFAVIKKEIFDEVGGFRHGYEGAQDWDLFIRISNLASKNNHFTIEHIPTVLYSWRKSSTSTASERYSNSVKSYAYNNQKKVLESDLEQRHVKGRVVKTKYLGLWRVKYESLSQPLISIIIPTKDNHKLISKCLDSILSLSTYKNFEMLLIDNGSTEDNVLTLYKDLAADKRISVIKSESQFNFSQLCNLGAKSAKGEHLLFLNNDVEIFEPDWIQNLLEHSLRKDVGVVGSKLLYPNLTVQSMGIVLVENDFRNDVFVAIHPGKYMNDESVQGFPAIHYKDSVRQVTAVSAACSMIKKSVFDSIGGFDEQLPVAYNDVDLCLRAGALGLRNIYTPYAPVIHHESSTLGVVSSSLRNKKQFKDDVAYFSNKWKNHEKLEKFYNPNLTSKKEDFSLQYEKN